MSWTTLVFITFYVEIIWVSNFGSNLSFFKISNLKGSNLVKWQDNQNKSCRSWWVEQLWCLSNFHLRSFIILDKNTMRYKLFWVSFFLKKIRATVPTPCAAKFRKLLSLAREGGGHGAFHRVLPSRSFPRLGLKRQQASSAFSRDWLAASG